MSEPVATPRKEGKSQSTPAGITPLRRGWFTSSFWVMVANIASIWLAAYKLHLSPELAAALTATMPFIYQYLRNERLREHTALQVEALARPQAPELLPIAEHPHLANLQARFGELPTQPSAVPGETLPGGPALRTGTAIPLLAACMASAWALFGLSGCAAVESITARAETTGAGGFAGSATLHLRDTRGLAK